MSTRNSPSSTLKPLPEARVSRLANVICPYCGGALTKGISTKEHVIGRRFVPKGKLARSWNLIVNACEDCNRLKSDLEDDISAITLQPDIFGRYAHDDKDAITDSRRKARESRSRRTAKPVRNSCEHVAVNMRLDSGLKIEGNFTGPPQIDPGRVFALARLQLQGFFYFITYKTEEKRGYWWPGGFYPVLEAGRRDWGNPVHRGFMDAVVDWEPRVIGGLADQFYRIVLRRHPDADCWSWAVEWNHSMRIVGFLGDKVAAQDIASQFPKLGVKSIMQGPNRGFAYREETALDEADDKLFHWD